MTTTLSDRIAAGRPLVVVFSRASCQPCRMLKPVIEKLSREFAATHDVIAIDADADPAAAAEHEVLNLPTAISFRSGSESARMIGFHPEPTVRGLFSAGSDQR
jgi:thioredoxin-like negative regulator of GroEL